MLNGTAIAGPAGEVEHSVGFVVGDELELGGRGGGEALGAASRHGGGAAGACDRYSYLYYPLQLPSVTFIILCSYLYYSLQLPLLCL